MGWRVLRSSGVGTAEALFLSFVHSFFCHFYRMPNASSPLHDSPGIMLIRSCQIFKGVIIIIICFSLRSTSKI